MQAPSEDQAGRNTHTYIHSLWHIVFFYLTIVICFWIFSLLNWWQANLGVITMIGAELCNFGHHSWAKKRIGGKRSAHLQVLVVDFAGILSIQVNFLSIADDTFDSSHRLPWAYYIKGTVCIPFQVLPHSIFTPTPPNSHNLRLVGRRRKHQKEKLVVYIDRYIDI